jgi:hypothetical protein
MHLNINLKTKKEESSPIWLMERALEHRKWPIVPGARKERTQHFPLNLETNSYNMALIELSEFWIEKGRDMGVELESGACHCVPGNSDCGMNRDTKETQKP